MHLKCIHNCLLEQRGNENQLRKKWKLANNQKKYAKNWGKFMKTIKLHKMIKVHGCHKNKTFSFSHQARSRNLQFWEAIRNFVLYKTKLLGDTQSFLIEHITWKIVLEKNGFFFFRISPLQIAASSLTKDRMCGCLCIWFHTSVPKFSVGITSENSTLYTTITRLL